MGEKLEDIYQSSIATESLKLCSTGEPHLYIDGDELTCYITRCLCHESYKERELYCIESAVVD
jgi:hypothetical protein